MRRKPLDLTIEYVEPEPGSCYGFSEFCRDIFCCVDPKFAALVKAVEDMPGVLAQARKVLDANADPAEIAKQQEIAALKRRLAELGAA